jgi:hypothetical protein
MAELVGADAAEGTWCFICGQFTEGDDPNDPIGFDCAHLDPDKVAAKVIV